MSTFSAYGMGSGGFKVNRPLDDNEREQHLEIKRRVSDEVHYDLSLIKLNSTFVEYVDKWYSMRGFVAMIGVVVGAIMGFCVAFGIYVVFSSGDWFFLLLAVMALSFFLWMARVFLSDAFTYTHYPIRLSRKNRQVYAFRRDGTVFKAGWDTLYWTIYDTRLGLGSGDLSVMGHVLDKDGTTVKESIALSMVDAGEAGRRNLLKFFEFVRRYMEEGAGPVLDALKPTPLIMLPGIDKEKESWAFGWERLTANWKGFVLLQIIFQVFFLPISVFRWLVMRTSKIPQWPQWVEDECVIEPNDPWIRDGRHRAGGLRG